jgi:hypothetical protein
MSIPIAFLELSVCASRPKAKSRAPRRSVTSAEVLTLPLFETDFILRVWSERYPFAGPFAERMQAKDPVAVEMMRTYELLGHKRQCRLQEI